jgi:hypothetical protein
VTTSCSPFEQNHTPFTPPETFSLMGQGASMRYVAVLTIRLSFEPFLGRYTASWPYIRSSLHTSWGMLFIWQLNCNYLQLSNYHWYYDNCEPASSVSIVSDYGLEDRELEVRSLAEAKKTSFSLCVQTSPEAHPASCTMGTEGPFPGGKARPGRDADHSPPSSAEVENKQELYLLSP